MTLKFTAVTLLSAVALAVARSIEPRARDISYTAGFDDLDAVVEILHDTPTVGIYKGLNFKLFYVMNDGERGLSSGDILATTKPNGVQTVSTTRPYMTSRYHGSNVTSFDLKSFNFGCTTGPIWADDDDPTTMFPVLTVDCNITVTGYRGTTKVAQQVFGYVSGDGSVLARLNGTAFSRVDTVRFRGVYGRNKFGFPLDGIVMDDIRYTVQQA